MTRDSDVTLYVEINNVTNSRITLHHYRDHNQIAIIISNITLLFQLNNLMMLINDIILEIRFS